MKYHFYNQDGIKVELDELNPENYKIVEKPSWKEVWILGEVDETGGNGRLVCDEFVLHDENFTINNY